MVKKRKIQRKINVTCNIDDKRETMHKAEETVAVTAVLGAKSILYMTVILIDLNGNNTKKIINKKKYMCSLILVN